MCLDWQPEGCRSVEGDSFLKSNSALKTDEDQIKSLQLRRKQNKQQLLPCIHKKTIPFHRQCPCLIVKTPKDHAALIKPKPTSPGLLMRGGSVIFANWGRAQNSSMFCFGSIAIIDYSMQRRNKRELRHNASCTPFPNIFKNENYILNSGCQFLPEDIFEKINRFQAITCDEINSLTFVRNEPHEHILHRMNEAFSSQSKMINHNLNFQCRDSLWRQEREEIDNDLREFRMIKSEEHYDCEQILNNPCFKSDLENLFIT